MEKIKDIVISFIVPVYNVEEYLERCIDSIINQGIKETDYEIILVNDGSTDGSLDICTKYENRLSCIRCYSQKNQGLSVARNTGISHAQGQYIMFVDSDDFLEPDKVPDLIKTADELDAELLFYRARFYPDRHEITNIQPFEIEKVYDGEYVLLHGMKVSSVWGNLYLRKFILRVGLKFFEGISHEDIEYNYRLYPHARRIVFSDIVAYHYNVSGESVTRTSDSLKLQKLMFDNVDVAANIIRYYQDSNFSMSLKDSVIRRMNSVVVSMLLLSFRDSKMNVSFIRQFLEYSCQRGIYPINGKTLSWKTTILIPWLNRKDFYLFLCKLFKR